MMTLYRLVRLIEIHSTELASALLNRSPRSWAVRLARKSYPKGNSIEITCVDGSQASTNLVRYRGRFRAMPQLLSVGKADLPDRGRDSVIP
jgi:hypothetical protein